VIIKFRKNVSKGSRFNQIYVPKDMENSIEVGDEVEVRLVRKCVRLHYSKGLKKLSEFKENLIKEIFYFLNEVANFDLVFVVGSFLTEKISYNDIDIVLITQKKENIEESIYNKLIEKFNLRFHIISIEEKKFYHLLKICPLTKAMFSKFICNKIITIEDERLIDKNHLKFLLMMPEDLLVIKLNSRTFFDNLRRLITIERFLKNESLDIVLINEELKKLISNSLYSKIKYNEEIENNSIDFLKRIIKAKLEKIKGLIQNGKK